MLRIGSFILPGPNCYHPESVFSITNFKQTIMYKLLVLGCLLLRVGYITASVLDVLKRENPDRCNIDLPEWTNSASYNDLLKFEMEEESLLEQCDEIPTYYLTGEFIKPRSCQALTLCNSTYCVQVQPDALVNFYTVPLSCLNQYDLEDDNSRFMSVETGPSKFKVFSVFHVFDLLTNAKFDKKRYFFNPNNQTLSSRTNFHYASKLCENVAEDNYFLEGLGDLPKQCSRVKFCDITSKLCYSLPFSSMKFAFTFPRKEDPDFKNLALPATCHVVNLDRARRHISKYTEYGMSQQKNSFGLLNFNLPGFRYCGPGK